jgi:hypothetical protein
MPMMATNSAPNARTGTQISSPLPKAPVPLAALNTLLEIAHQSGSFIPRGTSGEVIAYLNAKHISPNSKLLMLFAELESFRNLERNPRQFFEH